MSVNNDVFCFIKVDLQDGNPSLFGNRATGWYELDNENVWRKWEPNKSVGVCEKELGNMGFTASEIKELHDIIKVLIESVLDDLFN